MPHDSEQLLRHELLLRRGYMWENPQWHNAVYSRHHLSFDLRKLCGKISKRHLRDSSLRLRFHIEPLSLSLFRRVFAPRGRAFLRERQRARASYELPPSFRTDNSGDTTQFRNRHLRRERQNYRRIGQTICHRKLGGARQRVRR